jgi:predicted metal-dependent hydrolase
MQRPGTVRLLSVSNLSTPPTVDVDGLEVPIRFVRHRRARHYILRLTEDGAARVTVPPYGTRREAMAFVRERTEWLKKALAEWRAFRDDHAQLDQVLFRGRAHDVVVEEDLFGSTLRVAGFRISMATGVQPKDALMALLWRVARHELPDRVRVYAEQWGLPLQRVSVRNQKTRWGSCSSSGTISLNWRIVQAPEWVGDGVILHELMHLKELNHSPGFWGLVAEACPRYKEVDMWLRDHGGLLYDVGWTPTGNGQ